MPTACFRTRQEGIVPQSNRARQAGAALNSSNHYLQHGAVDVVKVPSRHPTCVFLAFSRAIYNPCAKYWGDPARRHCRMVSAP
jgi:hypothetical protein